MKRKMTTCGISVTLSLAFHSSELPNPTLQFPSRGAEPLSPFTSRRTPDASLSSPTLESSTVGPQDLSSTARVLRGCRAINKRMFRIFGLNSAGHVINAAVPRPPPPSRFQCLLSLFGATLHPSLITGNCLGQFQFCFYKPMG